MRAKKKTRVDIYVLSTPSGEYLMPKAAVACNDVSFMYLVGKMPYATTASTSTINHQPNSRVIRAWSIDDDYDYKYKISRRTSA